MTIKSAEEGRVDFDEEGRKLLARVHLLDDDDDANDNTTLDVTGIYVRRLHSYSNPIYKDAQTGGTIHVGNHMAAESLDKLNVMSPAPCRRIVYCLDDPGTKGKPFQTDPEFIYFDFNIGWWRQALGNHRDNPTKVLEYFQPFFDFLDTELAAGKAILIHCLAGAHRAGTAGIASLMYLTGMNAEEATQTAQKLRPIINPISDFPKLLKNLEEGLRLIETKRG